LEFAHGRQLKKKEKPTVAARYSALRVSSMNTV
jgi:hypothetical protein